MELQGIPKPSGVRKRRFLFVRELLWEMSYPYLIGMVAVVLASFCLRDIPTVKDEIRERIFGTAIGFSSIMAGFVSTLLGIMFSIRETKKVRQLIAAGLFAHLKRYLLESVLVNLALCLISVIGIFGCYVSGCSYDTLNALWACWTFLFAAALATVVRIVFIMHKLL